MHAYIFHGKIILFWFSVQFSLLIGVIIHVSPVGSHHDESYQRSKYVSINEGLIRPSMISIYKNFRKTSNLSNKERFREVWNSGGALHLNLPQKWWDIAHVNDPKKDVTPVIELCTWLEENTGMTASYFGVS